MLTPVSLREQNSNHRPYFDRCANRLWSLGDIMRRVSVAQLLRFAMVGGMANVKSIFSQKFPPNPESEKLEADTVAAYSNSYENLEKDCIDLELTSSLATVKKIQDKLAKPDISYVGLAPFDEELAGRLIDEADAKIFWH
jgi:hypothetical protein